MSPCLDLWRSSPQTLASIGRRANRHRLERALDGSGLLGSRGHAASRAAAVSAPGGFWRPAEAPSQPASRQLSRVGQQSHGRLGKHGGDSPAVLRAEHRRQRDPRGGNVRGGARGRVRFVACHSPCHRRRVTTRHNTTRQGMKHSQSTPRTRVGPVFESGLAT